MRHVIADSIGTWLATCMLALGVLAVSGIGALAQSAEPPASQPPATPCPSGGCPSPTPQPWGRVQFLGGRANAITSSTCGIPGIDTFHLVSVNPITTDEMDVTLAPWDPAFVSSGWPGTTVGTMTGPYTVVPCGTSAWAIYDASTGVFQLAACSSVSVPMSAC